MFRKISLLLSVGVVLASFPLSGFAGDVFGKAPEGEVSIIDYGVSGMGLGLFSGLSAGYLRYENESDKGKEILVSGGYGLLAGAGLGIILGAVDASNGNKGIGALILRDMKEGAKFGLLLGTVWGGINALNKDDSRFLGDGAAWGYLGGAVFGAAVAFIEAPAPASSSKKTSLNKHFDSSVVFMQDSKNNIYPALAAMYNF